jgi:hypothetical protein
MKYRIRREYGKGYDRYYAEQTNAIWPFCLLDEQWDMITRNSWEPSQFVSGSYLYAKDSLDRAFKMEQEYKESKRQHKVEFIKYP